MNNQPIHPINSIFIDQDLCSNLDNGNNTFVFKFARNVTTTKTSRMSVANFSVPFSWFNITAAIGNNKISYQWTDGISTDAIHAFTIPDGFYDLKRLNSYLQYCMGKMGHYMIDQNGNFVYFIELVQNTTYYRDQVNTFLLPQTLPAGWSMGSGINLSGPNAAPWKLPKLVLTDYNTGTSASVTSLFTYFGFKEIGQTSPPTFPFTRKIGNDTATSGTNPPSSSTLGELSPNQTQVHSVCLTCDYIDNPLRSTELHEVSTFVVTTQNIDVPFGTDIANSNFFTTWIPLLNGQTINQMTFRLLDQEGDPLLLQDPDTNIELLITDLRYS